MTDTPLHELYNAYNSKPRSDVFGAVRDTGIVNKKLASKHFIVEPESSRKDVTKEMYETMTAIEEIKKKSSLNKYLGSVYLQKTTSLQETKQKLKEATSERANAEVVNDMIK